MNHKEDFAIILRNQTFKDRHGVVTFLTKTHGLKKAFAYGSVASKRFGPSLQHGMGVKVSWTEKKTEELGQIQESVVLKHFPSVQSDYEKLTLSSEFSRYLEAIHPDEQNSWSYYQFFSNFLFYLESSNHSLGFFLSFFMKFLYLLGSQPNLDTCVQCEEPLMMAQRFRWALKQGGFLCPQCGESSSEISISSHSIQWMKKALNCSYEQVNHLELKGKTALEIEEYLYKFSAFHLEFLKIRRSTLPRNTLG